MKTRLRIKTGFIFLVLMLGLCSTAMANYSLSLDVTSDGSTPKTTFERGDVFFVNIVVNDAQGVAGCAVTLNYPTTVLTAPQTDADGMPVNSSDITGEYFPFTFTHPESGVTDTFRANSAESGKVYFSGAAIGANGGGSSYSGEKDLFTVKFTVKNDAPYGNFDLSLSQTTLDNADAGYTAPNNKVPVLVGAVAQDESGWDNLSSCEEGGEGAPCAFPVLLGGTSNPFAQVTGPTLTIVEKDSDGDGLKDSVETNTGIYIGPNDTGTDPNDSDTDNDGIPDGTDEYPLTHFHPITNPTPTWMTADGTITIDDVLAEDGDEVAAFVQNDQGGLIKIGVCTYGATVSGQYLIQIYGDDSQTQGKDGAYVDDAVIFKIYDVSQKIEYGLEIVDGSDSNAWADKVQRTINLKNIEAQVIPLHKGWNLVSFGVNKCYYTTNDPPNVEMAAGIEYEKVSSIDDILSSISGQYSYVMGFDETGGKSYNLTPLSNLKYMAAGYGYWIKVKDDADVDENGWIYLSLNGNRLSGSTAISLNEGWNLVGYLGQKVQYISTEPTVHFPSDCVKENTGSISDIFQSIDGQYSYVMGFDETGGKSYNLTPLSNLKYVGTGYGYWIKINSGESPDLVWE